MDKPQDPVTGATQPPRAPTIKDVAARAGVAIGTVSRYLNKLPIREASEQAIAAAISELGFRKNYFAAAIKSDRSRLVAFMVPEFDEFHTALMRRLMGLLKKEGLLMLIYYHSGDRASFRDAIQFFGEYRVDALITTGSIPKDAKFAEMQRSDLPVVVYENRIEAMLADEVLVSNKQAAEKAVGHLVEMGHRRIAIVTGNLEQDTGRERLQGYRAALAAQGIEAEARYEVGGSWSQAEGYGALQTLMGLAEPPTAVFFSNYVLALGGLAYVKANGLRVPEQLSIVSFDDVPAFQLFTPPITAVAQPIDLIADSIATLLFNRLLNKQVSHARTVVLPCELVLRDSVRRLA